MKRKFRNYLAATGKLCALCALGIALAACGSSDGGDDQTAGIGGTGIAVGKITQFGSIFVNGNKFNTDSSRFIVDGDSTAVQDDLEIGMVVKLEVETSNGEFTGKAIEVEYDDEVQGPIEMTPELVNGSQKTFDVFGQTITVDEIGTRFKNTGFDTLAADDVVEISGFRTAPDAITATYVEHKCKLVSCSEVELRGTVSGYSPPAMQFMLGGVLIVFDSGTELELPGGILQNGLFVEVEGSYQTDPVISVHAEEIELEEEGFGDDVDDVSLQGIISEFVDIGDFKVNGLQVDASGAEFEPANAATMLDDGVEVEVEGDIVAGVLIADELELRQGDAELHARVAGVDVGGGSFEVRYPVLTAPFNVVVRVDSQTVFEDETGAVPATPPFSLDDLAADVDFVLVEGRQIAGEVVASVVKRSDDDDDLKLGGFVDDYVPGVSITILGIAYGVDGDTEYEPDPPDIEAGDLVEIEDDNLADGIADEVEEDD